MALISLRQLLDHAAEHHYGVAAYNVNNLDSIINEAYKKEVIAIQEYPYSFMATDNPKIISYTFIE